MEEVRVDRNRLQGATPATWDPAATQLGRGRRRASAWSTATSTPPLCSPPTARRTDDMTRSRPTRPTAALLRPASVSFPRGRHFADGHEYLRFDAFDDDPHYHYVQPTGDHNQVVTFDADADGPVLPWVLSLAAHPAPGDAAGGRRRGGGVGPRRRRGAARPSTRSSASPERRPEWLGPQPFWAAIVAASHKEPPPNSQSVTRCQPPAAQVPPSTRGRDRAAGDHPGEVAGQEHDGVGARPPAC